MTGKTPESGHEPVHEHPSSDNPRETIMSIVEFDNPRENIMSIVEFDYESINFDPLQAHYSYLKYVVYIRNILHERSIYIYIYSK